MAQSSAVTGIHSSASCSYFLGTSPMPKAIRRSEILVSLQRNWSAPMRVQLERGLRVAIQTVRLRSGSILPSSRVLASELEISRGLVVEVYEQLLAEGYLCARRGASTYVAERPVKTSAPARQRELSRSPRYDFRPGRPDHSLFPRRAWLSALHESLSASPAEILDYHEPRAPLPP